MRARALAVSISIGLVASAAAVSAAPASILYSGRGFGGFVNVDSVLATFVCDTGALPSIGGTLETTATDVLLDHVLSAGFMSTQAYTNATGTNCFTQTTGLSVLPGTPAALTASVVSSISVANCTGTASSFTVTNLVFGGTPIQVTGASNQTVSIPGVATLTIDERIDSITPTSTEITSNALHLDLTAGGEVIISSSHAGVSNCVNVAAQPLPWSSVKSLYRDATR